MRDKYNCPLQVNDMIAVCRHRWKSGNTPYDIYRGYITKITPHTIFYIPEGIDEVWEVHSKTKVLFMERLDETE